jgi:hypothetical protein
MGWATTIVAPPDGSMADYMDSLDRLQARPEDTYAPAHGGTIARAHAYVRGLRSHRKMREAAILEGLRRGDRTIPEIVARVYQGLDARLAGAAALSTLAHLEDLAARGQVVTGGPPMLDGRYSRRVRRGVGIRLKHRSSSAKLLIRRAFSPRSCTPRGRRSGGRPACRGTVRRRTGHVIGETETGVAPALWIAALSEGMPPTVR